MKEDLRFFIGIDSGAQSHQVCVLDVQGAILGEHGFAHSGDGLAELCAWALDLCEGACAAIGVAIETPHGAVVETLLERGLAVHSINPKQLDRFRDRFTVAGAKDDRRDAHVLGDCLRTDRHCLRRLEPGDPLIVELRGIARLANELSGERVRLANRIHEQLRRIFPQAIEITDDVTADWFAAVWRIAPNPVAAKRVGERRIAVVLAKHRIRRIDAATARRHLTQPALVTAPGTVEACTAHLESLFERAGLLNKQIKHTNRRMDALCRKLADPEPGCSGEQRDVDILRSQPGIGRIVLATLLAEAWQPLRDRDYHALRGLCGTAPVTRQSGKRRVVVMRRACNPRLREAAYHWARISMQLDPISRRRYHAFRQRGHSHGRALRGVADRLLLVICASLRNGTPYDPNHRARSDYAS